MSEGKDPERLLADALRAQAVFAPSTTPVESTAGSMPPLQYGLLSGTGADSLERERAALDSSTEEVTPPTVRQPVVPTQSPLPVVWILVLAVLLGLAAGSVVGLLTLL
ncbi:hypothetical protein [Amycolatopsis sp. NPDC059657]|uniref:hypothetical protein n=1 Tax=Amycolatopsis sp. NPDC059657 TaxID=3346899 RepID=UPI0036707482